MNKDSFEKGEKFEKFVLDKLFQSSHYDLVHQTNTTSQNQYRFVENSLKPDFKFRCKRTKREFYVEAKYRSDFNRYDDKIEVMRPDQFERYIEIQRTENIPVFVMIGYQGKADYPALVSLIPLEQLQHLEAYPSFLQKFNIPKNNINSDDLNLLDFGDIIKKPQEEEKGAKNIEPEKLVYSKPKSRTLKYAFGVLLLLSFVFYGMMYYSKDDVDEKLHKKTQAYYQTLEMGEVDNLDYYVNPTVGKWYNKTDLTLEEIKTEAQHYLKQYPHTKTDIQWDTFEITPLNDDYLVTYNIDYQIFSKRLKNRIYHLKIKALWGENLKLKSMYETRE